MITQPCSTQKIAHLIKMTRTDENEMAVRIVQDYFSHRKSLICQDQEVVGLLQGVSKCLRLPIPMWLEFILNMHR